MSHFQSLSLEWVAEVTARETRAGGAGRGSNLRRFVCWGLKNPWPGTARCPPLILTGPTLVSCSTVTEKAYDQVRV